MQPLCGGLVVVLSGEGRAGAGGGNQSGVLEGTQVKDELSFKEVASIFVSMASFLKATIPYRLRTAEYPESPCLPP